VQDLDPQGSNARGNSTGYGHLIRIRSLTSDDWQILRAVRLRSLQDSPQAFTSTYGQESEFDEATWREQTEGCQWFVAYDGDQSVEIAAGVPGWTNDPTKRELIGMWVPSTSEWRSGMIRPRSSRSWSESSMLDDPLFGCLRDRQDGVFTPPEGLPSGPAQDDSWRVG
jgi:hypothetical protein